MCLHNESCSSPVTVTDNRLYLNGEPWVLTREADLLLHLERQADSPKSSSPMLSCAASPPFDGLHGRGLLFRSSPEGEDVSMKSESNSPGSGYYNWQPISDPESPCPLYPGVSKTSQEAHNCVRTGSCKRLHLSHPHLGKKIVQKARRALSKWGIKPGSKAYRSFNSRQALRQDSTTFKDSAQDANLDSVGSYRTQSSELPAGDGTVQELPAEMAAANIAAVYEAPGDYFHHKPLHATCGHYSEPFWPQTSFDRYYGSGSSISTWNQNLWQSPSSTKYSSNSEELGLTSPENGLGELEDSPASSSGYLFSTSTTKTSWTPPLTGENTTGKIVPMQEGTLGQPRLDVGVTAATESISRQKQPLEDSVMAGWDFCASPTSLLAEDGCLDRQIEENRVHELGSENCGAYKSTTYETAVTTSSFDDVTTRENARKSSSALSTWSSSDAHPSDEYRITVPLCPCHKLPMRPDMDLSDLVAGAKSCGVSSSTLVPDSQATLGARIQSMFTLLLEIALTKLDGFDCEIRNILDPAFEADPTFRASLKALSALHAGQRLSSIHELVSLVFMAFSIAILTVNESDLSQYAGVMYIEMASWTEALSSPTDKHAFSLFLEILWWPQVRYPTVPFQQREFCPVTNPKELSTQDCTPSLLLSPIGLRTGMTVELCQCYVDLIFHAAADEVASGMYSPDHVLGKYPPPVFVDSAMDAMAPYLEQQIPETLREVASSTVQALRDGKLSSFNQVDEHLKFEVLNRAWHFGDLISGVSQNFSALCHSASATFAGRKVAWLMGILRDSVQDSASRVVSQKWAEDVDPPKMQRWHDGTTSRPGVAIDSPSTSPSDLKQSIHSTVQSRFPPGLNKSPATRKGGRQRKVSHDILPSTCSKCGRMFEGKYHRDHLRRHVKSVHSDRRITCKLCGRRLKDRKDNFAKHLKACHSMDSTSDAL